MDFFAKYKKAPQGENEALLYGKYLITKLTERRA